jgi:hypothetical protein
LNLDDQLGIIQLLGQADIGGLQLVDLLYQWADNHFGAALLGCEGIELSLFALPPPSAQVRRVQAFTAQQGTYCAGILSGIGLVEDGQLILGVKRRRCGRATTSESGTRGRQAGSGATAALAP